MKALGAVLALATLLGGPLARAADSAAPQPSSRRAVSVRDAPGYFPPSDPESLSEVTGRRENAPLVSLHFTGGTRSLNELGRTVCRCLHHSQTDSLTALCVNEQEFREILWREFPQSRPAVGLTWLDAWKILWARLHAGVAHSIRDQGGHYYKFLRIEYAKTDRPAIMRYRNFRMHNGLILVVQNDEGQVERWTWLRAVVERKGRFKIYSTDD